MSCSTTWLSVDEPSAPNRFQVIFIFEAPSERPEKLIPVTFVEGLTRFPFESKVNDPVAARGSNRILNYAS